MRAKPTSLILTLIIMISVTSCSFNNQFYHPKPLKAPITTSITHDNTGDMLYTMHIVSHKQPPVFITPKGDTVDFDYRIENILFSNRQEDTLHGWFISPTNSVPPKATLLFLHGNGGNILSYLSLVFPFVKMGYQAFIFDYSGYGFSSGKPNRGNVLSDANAAVELISQRSDVESTMLLLYGQSLGGHLAPTVANMNSKAIDGVILEGAFSSHKDIAAHSVGFIGRLMVREAYPAKTAVKNLHKPILIIHSINDSVIPASMAKQLFENANEPKDYFEIDECHICGPLYYADEIDKRISKLMKLQN
ncbi:MAG: alpha/beta fold hydrolase [Bacteroidales bacterium]|nr:alpha/beta fold hydrolase [Bacteroidales bacterium]